MSGLASATLLRAVVPTLYGDSSDVPSASPNAMDDEFRGAALDGKWSWVNQGGATATVVDGAVVLAVNETAEQLRGIRQAISGSWTVKAKVGALPDTADFSYVSLFAGVSDTGACAGAVLFGSGGLLNVGRITYGSSPSGGGHAATSLTTRQQMWFYLQLVWDATTLSVQFSPTGVSGTFLEIATWVPGAALAIVGLGITNRRGAARAFPFDWFRRVA